MKKTFELTQTERELLVVALWQMEKSFRSDLKKLTGAGVQKKYCSWVSDMLPLVEALHKKLNT